MSTTLPRSGSFVKDMFLEHFTKGLSKSCLVENEKTLVHSTCVNGDETITLVVFGSDTKSKLKVNCAKTGKTPYIQDNWPIPHSVVVSAINTNSNTLLVDLLCNDKDLQQIIAAQLPNWGAEWSNRSLKDRVSLPSLPASKAAPPAL